MHQSTPPPIPSAAPQVVQGAVNQWVPAILLVGLIGLERGVYYGVRALVILFMVDTMELDYTQGYIKYGLAGALGFLTLVPGGLIGDFLLARRWTIPLSFLLEGLGAILIAFGGDLSVRLGWGALIAGTGLMRPNTWAYLGDLMPGDRSRRMGVFFLAMIGINVFAMLGPLVGGLFLNQAAAIGFFGGIGLLMALVSGALVFTGLLPDLEKGAGKSAGSAALGGVGALLLALVGFLTLQADLVVAETFQTLVGFGTIVLVVLGFVLIAVQDGRKAMGNLGLGLVLLVSVLFWLAYEVNAGAKFSFYYENKPEFLEIDQLFMLNPILNLVLGAVMCLLLFVVFTGKGKIKLFSGILLGGTLLGILAAVLVGLALKFGGGMGLILLIFLAESLAEILVSPLLLGLTWEMGHSRLRSTGMGMVMGAFGIVSLVTGWIVYINKVGLFPTVNLLSRDCLVLPLLP